MAHKYYKYPVRLLDENGYIGTKLPKGSLARLAVNLDESPSIKIGLVGFSFHIGVTFPCFWWRVYFGPEER